MGNALGVYVTYFSWPSDQGADSKGRDQKDVVEVEQGRVTTEEPEIEPEVATNVLSKREIRRRRRLGITGGCDVGCT